VRVIVRRLSKAQAKAVPPRRRVSFEDPTSSLAATVEVLERE
jgi:hypothetical protein